MVLIDSNIYILFGCDVNDTTFSIDKKLEIVQSASEKIS